MLTIGLIFLTAVAVTAFHFTQQWRDETQKLKIQGIQSTSDIAAEEMEKTMQSFDME